MSHDGEQGGTDTVIVDQEFSRLVPALTEDEHKQLERQLVRDGCLAPLVVWEETDVLLDGHHRKALCEQHGIGYQVRHISLPDRQAAIQWIIQHQLGRRNLADIDKIALARKLEEMLRPVAKQRQAAAGPREGRGKKATGCDKIVTTGPTGRVRRAVSAQAGVSEGTYAAGKYILDAIEQGQAEPEILERLRQRESSIHAEYVRLRRQQKERRRQERRAANARQVDQTGSLEDLRAAGAKFATLVLDPPWDWGDEGDCDQLGRARPVYATMPLEKLLELPVADLADQDCHLYLWITNRSLPKGFVLLERWGFRYITALTWCKPHFGMGNYFRGSTEHVLFGVRGSQALKRQDVGTWFAAPRGPRGHSSKPEEFYRLVESCSPGPYLELFARGRRDGWVAWGAETDAA